MKAGYGLTSAPRRWWGTVKADLAKLGFTAFRTEPCLWVWHEDGKAVGAVCLHVDDFLVAGQAGS
eukprot:6370187-Lingulodinium_polyedra.AAC.1